MFDFKNVYKKMNYKAVLAFVFLFISPVISAIIICLQNNVFPTDISIFSQSVNNDSVFYHHEILSCVKYGHLLGNFGAGGSQQGVLDSYYLWSPVLNLPYVAFGKIVGNWGLSSVYIVNLILLIVAMVLFVVIARPSVRQIILIGVVVVVSGYIGNMVWSGILECSIWAFDIIWIATIIALSRDRLSIAPLVISLLIGVYLTLCRPYYLLTFICLTYICRMEWKRTIAIVVCVIASVKGYFYIVGNYCSMTLVGSGAFGGEGQSSIIRSVFGFLAKILTTIKSLSQIMLSMLDGSAQGYMVVLLFLLLCLSFYKVLLSIRKGKRLTSLDDMYLCYIILIMGMLGAITFYWSVGVAMKHLLEFLIMGSIIACMNVDDKRMIGTLIVLLVCMSISGGYEITGERQDDMDELAKASLILEEVIPIEQDGDRWDNTVVYTHGYTPFEAGFALPAGTALQLCEQDHVLNSYDDIKAKYLYSGNPQVIEKCEEEGAELLYQFMDCNFYRLR